MKMDYCRICKTQTRHEREGECAICEYRERLGLPADAVSVPVSIPSPTPPDTKAPASPKKDLQADTKVCPHCAESILVAAKKCRHCGEWLHGPRSAVAPPVERKGGPTHALLLIVVVVGIGIAVWKLLVPRLQRKEEDIAALVAYTDQITSMFHDGCKGFTRTQALEFAIELRDKGMGVSAMQLRGNPRYCSPDVTLPMEQAEIAACLAGPPKGYPPLSKVLPIVRDLVRAGCRR